MVAPLVSGLYCDFGTKPHQCKINAHSLPSSHANNTELRLQVTMRGSTILPWSPRNSFGRNWLRYISSAYAGHARKKPQAIKVSDEVQDAVHSNKPVVALETTIYTHGGCI